MQTIINIWSYVGYFVTYSGSIWICVFKKIWIDIRGFPKFGYVDVRQKRPYRSGLTYFFNESSVVVNVFALERKENRSTRRKPLEAEERSTMRNSTHMSRQHTGGACRTWLMQWWEAQCVNRLANEELSGCTSSNCI